jgi:riboflavin synthase alpha subunit
VEVDKVLHKGDSMAVDGVSKGVTALSYSSFIYTIHRLEVVNT